MRFLETAVAGAYVMEPERMEDERGSFARVWCAKEMAARGLDCVWVQSSISTNTAAGTLRGLHYQAPPQQETKLVMCTSGAVWDVIVDLRSDSPTFCGWYGVELSEANGRVLYIPRGLAHGFLTLRDDSVVQYHMSEYYEPGAARGVRWNDPSFGVVWPEEPRVMSSRDRDFPDFRRTP